MKGAECLIPEILQRCHCRLCLVWLTPALGEFHGRMVAWPLAEHEQDFFFLARAKIEVYLIGSACIAARAYAVG